ncbi:MAG: hypothetical protein V2I56_21460 [Desulfobacteraceae bacterium]|nr:hypothetical protein [Desulfobacteraceae bacterium]
MDKPPIGLEKKWERLSSRDLDALMRFLALSFQLSALSYELQVMSFRR